MLRELEAFWRLGTPGWGQRRAHEAPQVPFWAILALSGAEMGPKGFILEVKSEINGSQNRCKTRPKINANNELILNQKSRKIR